MVMTAVATRMATTKGAAAMQGVAATEGGTAKGATTAAMQSMTAERGAAKAVPTAKRNTSEADGVAMQGAMHRRV